MEAGEGGSGKSANENLWNLSGLALAKKIRSGEVSAFDAAEAHIARVEEVNPRLNSVVVKARAEARELDRRRAAGEPQVNRFLDRDWHAAERSERMERQQRAASQFHNITIHK